MTQKSESVEEYDGSGTCPCGRRVVAIQGDGAWPAWAMFERLAEEHARACPMGRVKWALVVGGVPTRPSSG